MLVVTGANGFIGSVLVKDLNQLNSSNILCVDPIMNERRPQPLSNKKYKNLISSDLFLNQINTHDFDEPIDAIFHMGACSSTTETNREYLQKNNTEYTKSLFQYCTQNEIPFIYASSGAVYGNGSQGFDDNTDPKNLTPLNLYGWSKADFDVWALQQKEAPPKWFGLRFFNVYGPNEYHKNDMSSVVFKAFHQIQETNELKLFKSHNPKYKDGEQLRDFVYVKDISRWMIELYQTENIKNGIYNLGTGQSRTWLDLARAVFKNMNKELKINWIDIPEHIRDQYQYYTEAKMDKLYGQNLSKPQWSLENGIEDYVLQHLNQKDPTY